MDLQNVLGFLVGFLGFILAVVISVVVIVLVRKPLIRLLANLIGDEMVAGYGVTLVLILLGLEGLDAALGYITQTQLSQLFGGLIRLLDGLAGVIQWAIYIAALLFIAYSIRGWRGSSDQGVTGESKGEGSRKTE
jgi:hypothetical protein